jgi:hypothetical protein
MSPAKESDQTEQPLVTGDVPLDVRDTYEKAAASRQA